MSVSFMKGLGKKIKKNYNEIKEAKKKVSRKKKKKVIHFLPAVKN